MRSIRLFHDGKLSPGACLQLHADAFAHAVKVLRVKVGDPLVLFNGDGHDYHASLTEVTKKHALVKLEHKTRVERESTLKLHLLQVISRGDKMDFTLQKAVELGVDQITPLLSERCGVKLSQERMQKKWQHRQGVIISACEQCGRARIPQLKPLMELSQALQACEHPLLLLHPEGGRSLRQFEDFSSASLLIGPEGGFSEQELALADEANACRITLGPRVLRTETAAMSAISALQALYGDF